MATMEVLPVSSQRPDDEVLVDSRTTDGILDDDERSIESETFQGKSDCGFSDTVHDTLMAAGKAIHNLVGEPHSIVESAMKETGDFVKDTAVALHDFSIADGSIIKEETHELLRMMTGDEGDEDEKETITAAATGDPATTPKKVVE
mmetsp:Transcript_30613/g.34911  ORF Transcript_30613/g.34911 Transcript_30613/m.34911 type:complete len:146 (+) Transcript_30613:54-491(+)|eukprot:CAMPEP_0194145332 /NCGR_PEP_ID=MMETSP0152-20130528/16863_1 /TAXON_ID=1049557 /ORGANISM="Thalassiothrix antarctica, Strain L6-D1" /LENGTH=145 /DNA_ID=CAMNT_0038845525 /DNA_START=36 /DNA_END=473 /DNA_ORIENTATION=+